MGKLDDMAKKLYEDNRVFADTMNVLFFDGQPMISAQDLSPLDPTEEHTICEDDFVKASEQEEKTGKAEAFSTQKYRDVLRMLQTQNGKLEVRIIVGAEIQSHVHYAMPIRNFEYDALNLSRQLSARQKYNRENHLLKSRNDLSHLDSLTAGIISEACNMNIPKQEL